MLPGAWRSKWIRWHKESGDYSVWQSIISTKHIQNFQSCWCQQMKAKYVIASRCNTWATSSCGAENELWLEIMSHTLPRFRRNFHIKDNIVLSCYCILLKIEFFLLYLVGHFFNINQDQLIYTFYILFSFILANKNTVKLCTLPIIS